MGPMSFSVPSVQDGTRQRRSLCQVFDRWALSKGSSNGPQTQHLCRVYKLALSKDFLFDECYDYNTRQRSFIGSQACLLCRVLWSLHSAKALFISVTLDKVTRDPLFYLFLLFYLNKIPYFMGGLGTRPLPPPHHSPLSMFLKVEAWFG